MMHLAVQAQVLAVVIWLAIFFACAMSAGQDNLLQNPSFEEVRGDEGHPAHWTPIDFRTGGSFAVGNDGGKTGRRYVILRASEDRNRSCWRQQVLWSDQNQGVTVGGWYRTRGVKAAARKGASIRFLFNDDPKKWRHLGIKTVYFPPAKEWTHVQATFPVPEGTRAVVIELFHWFTPGETHWDDVWIRPATKDELARRPLDSSLAPDREPVLGTNLPYSPADGETVQLNPPPFLWLPSGNDVTYRLQIARDATFKDGGLIALEGIEWCCEMLTEPLEQGTWYWRYGVDRRGAPTIWSKPRRFVIAADATLWPYPGRDAFHAPHERPHLFISNDRLSELRRRAKEGDLKGVAERLARSVRKHIGEELVAEPDWLPKGRDERRNAYTLTFRATRPPMDLMERAALVYLLTGDDEYGAEAKRRVLHFFSWDPAGPTSVFHNDEPAMWVMMRGVRAYDWTYDLFTPEERRKVEASMRTRAADFYKAMRARPFENNPFASHAGRIIGFLGEAAIEFLNDWPEAREWLDYITKIYWGVYPAWGKDDGGWNEGPGYWSAYMTFGLHFVVALREATGIDISQRPFFRNTPYYCLYLTPPHTQMSPFGDGTQWRPRRPGPLMYWFSTLTRDPVIRWYAESVKQGAGDSILGIVLKDDTLKGEPPHELPTARFFEGVGLVCMHTNLVNGAEDVAFAMRSSPYGAVSHGHNDQNCFVLEAYGEALAIATGYYNNYGSPHHAGWTRQTKAKCGVTYDGGKGQDRGWQAQGRITAFVHGEDFDLAIGDATKAYGGRLTRAVREVVHVRPGLFVIRDDLASTEPKRYEFWLHAIDKMEVDEAAATVVTRRPKATLTTRFLHPRGLTITQTDKFDPHPIWPPGKEYANNWHVTAVTGKSAEVEFLTVLMPSKAGNEGNLPAVRSIATETARGVELTHPDGARDIVGFALPRAKGSAKLGDITADARVFAVSYDPGGNAVSYLINDGTSLKAGGIELCESAEPTTLTGRKAVAGK